LAQNTTSIAYEGAKGVILKTSANTKGTLVAKSYSALGLNSSNYSTAPNQVIGAAKKIANQVKISPSGVIDGVVRNVPKKNIRTAHTKVVHKHSDLPSAQSVHRKAKRSYTLMRQAVAKPTPNAKKHHSPLQTKHFFDQHRAQRASEIAKSTGIKKFANIPARTASLSQSKPKMPVNPPASKQSTKSTAQTTVLPSLVTSVSSHHLEQMLDQALLRANSHREQFLKETGKKGYAPKIFRKRRLTGATAVVLISILLGIFFAWQNVPQMSMKIAAARAHIPASIPSYTPSGFSFAGPINYQDGVISLSFKAHGDNSRAFVITQQKSNWDSDTLALNVIPRGTPVQTSEIHGNKIYIYGDTNDATWVNKGMRYTVKDLANLNSDQLIKLADSL
jgi:hypothetical protein